MEHVQFQMQNHKAEKFDFQPFYIFKEDFFIMANLVEETRNIMKKYGFSAYDFGYNMVKQAPPSRKLREQVMLAPHLSKMLLQMESPSPLPLLLVVNLGVKSLSIFSSDTPGPLSSITISQKSGLEPLRSDTATRTSSLSSQA